MDNIREIIYKAYEDIQIYDIVKYVRIDSVNNMNKLEKLLKEIQREIPLNISVIEGEMSLFLKIEKAKNKPKKSKFVPSKSDLGL